MLKNFFWNTWDNLARVLGLSALGTVFNAILVFSIVVLWGAAKLPPHKLRPPETVISGTNAFLPGYPRIEIKDQFVTLLAAAPANAEFFYTVSTNTKAAPGDAVRSGKAGTHGSGRITLQAREIRAIPLLSTYRADLFWSIQLATPQGTAAARITLPAFTDEDAYNFLSQIIFFLILSLSFPTMAVLAHNARRLIEGTAEGFFREVWLGVRKMFLPGLKLFLCNALVYFIFYVAFGFYIFNLKRLLGVDIPPLRWAAIGITGWLFTFFTMMQMYLIPLLVYKPKEKFTIILKRASLLTVDNVVQTFSVLLFTFVLFALSFFSLAVITILLPGLVAMLHVTNFSVLLNRYEPPEEQSLQGEKKKDDSAERETRSWRTIFRPWE